VSARRLPDRGCHVQAKLKGKLEKVDPTTTTTSSTTSKKK
jgi:hypothetical protein